MAQNQPYAHYPYYAQPQNIYQQLGKPQPQPHLQSAYQQQPQQQQLVHVPQQPQYQYTYQHPQQQQQQPQALQRVPSAQGFQQPQSPFPNTPPYVPQQQQQQQQPVYQYTQPGVPTPTPAPAMYQRPPSQNNSRIPTSSFPNLPPGQPVPHVLPRQIMHNQAVNAAPSGQLVPTSQSLTLRGPSPIVPPGPPISPSAMFAQQVQQQHHHHQQQQQQLQPQQQTPSMTLVPGNRNSGVIPMQRQIMPPPQIQSQPQPQAQQQMHSQPLPQAQPPPLPPRQSQQPQQQQSQGIPPTSSQRRPLPSPGAPRPFPSINTTINAIPNTPTSSSVPNTSPIRTSLTQTRTPSQPASPSKATSPVKVPSSPTKSSRPLPTPGGGSGVGSGGASSSSGREGFAGIGTKQNSSRVTGLPISPTISSMVTNIKPMSLTILPLPEGSNLEKDDTPTSPVKTGADGSLNKRRASPPRFQPGAPTKDVSPSLPSTLSISNAHASPSASASGLKSSPPSLTTSQTESGTTNMNNTQTPTNASPKKFTPVWKRTIPEYPQPAFGYAAGMVADPFTPTAKQPSPGTKDVVSPQKRSPQAPGQITQAEMRTLVEKEHVERQLKAAMAQAHAQAQAQQNIAGMPISNTSYSAYAMYSRSNPNLHQSSHIRSGAYGHEGRDEDDSDEDEEEGVVDGEEEETEETEEEREARRRKHGKKGPQSTGTGKKKKKDVKEKKAQKKPKHNPPSASVPPKKRISRANIPSTSEDESETTEMTPEELEEAEYRRTSSRHAKSPSASSSRFKAKVEREKESLKKKRSSLHDYVEEYYDDDDDTPRKRDPPQSRRRESPPASQQRQSYYQRPGALRRGSPSPPPSHSGFDYGGRHASPSPPPSHRVSRRVSPPRISLLKDAQRKTIKLRGGDDEDGFDDGGRERREEVGRWKKDERYRSRERERGEKNDAYLDRERYGDERRRPAGYREREEDEYEYGRIRQEEREARYAMARNNGGHHSTNSVGGLPQPPTVARRRGDIEEREDQWSRSGLRDERDSNIRIFNLGRQESPVRQPVRDSVFAAGYRSRPASPTRSIPQHRQPSRNSPSDTPLMSPYRSRPTSPAKLVDDRGSGDLVTKFSAINIHDQERTSARVAQGDWPTDLPRLPRTPGETPNPSVGGYFDVPVSRDVYSGSGSRASAEFTRMSGRSIATNDSDIGYSNSTRPVRRDTRNPQHYNNLDMNLDDPPPRSLSPAISQGSSTYGGNEQPLQHQRVQGQLQSSTTARPISHYDNMISNAPPEPLSPIRQRPQSQVYSRQVHPQPLSPRPPSINPLDRANMNTTSISNGTPKVQTINIESPAPVGGREKRADLNRMMSDPEDEDFVKPVRRINVGGGFDGDGRRDISSPRGPMIQVDSSRVPVIQVKEPRRGPTIQVDSPRAPIIQVDSPKVPIINVNSPQGPMINIESSPPRSNPYPAPKMQVYDVPGISIAGPEFDDGQDDRKSSHPRPHQQQQQRQVRPRPGTRSGLICGGCDGPIIGRIVSAMGARWHPQCFRCTVCNELLEHVSSYEHDGRPYCHLDYHENFAPRCFSCKTAIIEERFISLDDPGLGKRTYHEQHFFCAECGDPFLAPSMNNSSRTGELSVQGDGEFESDDVGFTVYRGHPYCEVCHVRLRLPKCKKCKKSIRDHEQAVEALGGKWCWGCFVCAGCARPFENPSFFQRGEKPFCERCFDLMLRNEV